METEESSLYLKREELSGFSVRKPPNLPKPEGTSQNHAKEFFLVIHWIYQKEEEVLKIRRKKKERSRRGMTHSCLPKPEGTLLFLILFFLKIRESFQIGNKKSVIWKKSFFCFLLFGEKWKNNLKTLPKVKGSSLFFIEKTRKKHQISGKEEVSFLSQLLLPQRKGSFIFPLIFYLKL